MASASRPLRNWSELPSDIMANILTRLDLTDIFDNVDKVCTTWHRMCEDPAIWRVIKLNFNGVDCDRAIKILKLSVDRSQGQLVDFTMNCGDDELFQYVADRSSNLRRLEIVYAIVYDNCSPWSEALKMFPLLEELNLYSTYFSKEDIESVGQHCPMLKTLKVNRSLSSRGGDTLKEIANEFAKAIGENLSGLKHLELIGLRMSNMGLYSILDGCRDLETLDLRNCRNIDLNKDLLKRCSEQIKHLKLPDDSLEGCPHGLDIFAEGSDDYALDYPKARDYDSDDYKFLY